MKVLNLKPTISVVIPAHNEVDNILVTLESLKTDFNKSGITAYEVIVVDDHSDDDTYEAVQSLQDAKIFCIRLSRRVGSFMAIRAGFRLVKGDAALCIAADG